jgi:hypothetical protein
VAAVPPQSEAAFAMNFQHVAGATPITYLGNQDDGNCDWGGPCSANPDVYEMVTGSDGKSYWHYVVSDPAQGFKEEVYIRAPGGAAGDLFDAGGALADTSGNGTTLGNADNPLGSNSAITGNGTGNPESTAIHMILTEPSANPTLENPYSFQYEFLKAQTSTKPLIEMQINPTSADNKDLTLYFKADMSGVGYGDKSTDISDNPLKYQNVMTINDPFLKAMGTADFNAATGSQDSSVTAGRYTFTPGAGWSGGVYHPGTYTYIDGTGFDPNTDWSVFKN